MERRKREIHFLNEDGMVAKAPFRLREMQRTDSATVSDLITEEGGFMTTYFAVDAYSAMIDYAELRTVGVVAEVEGYDGLAGVATVRFGACQFNGELLPFAFLDNLKVAEPFRNRGLGTLLAEWRVNRARSEFGHQALLLSGTTTDNVASQRTMKKWCREFTDPMALRVTRTIHRPPKALCGIIVREARPAEYEELAHKQNAFYQAYNLYIPVSTESLAAGVTSSPAGEPLTRHFVAVSASGELVAGASVRYTGDLTYDKLNLPLPLRAANLFLRLIPPDNILRGIEIRGLWCAAGHEAAARQLLDTIRYEYHRKGSAIGLALDDRSPFTKIVRKNRLLPLPRLIMGLWGPTPLDRDRLLHAHGRA